MFGAGFIIKSYVPLSFAIIAKEERAGCLILFVSCFILFYEFCLSMINCLFPTVLWIDL